jgi:hypothetical protein
MYDSDLYKLGIIDMEGTGSIEALRAGTSGYSIDIDDFNNLLSKVCKY